jgi:hypothetical protein
VFVATGTPTQAFVDAFKAALEADPPLMALIAGVFGHLSEATRTAYPYLVLGQRTRRNDGGAMQIAGGRLELQLDGWSDHKGPSEITAIGAAVVRVLERRPLRIAGYELLQGSLTCELDDVVDEPDPDKPKSRLYHGVQLWTAEIHQAA